jgi:hypothetical protein
MHGALAERQEREFGFAEVTRGGQTMNPVTLVTPIVRRLAARLSHEQQRAIGNERFSPALEDIEPLGGRNISAQSLCSKGESDEKSHG